MPSSTGSFLVPPQDRRVDVRGSVPAGLSGRMLGVGQDGVVHSLAVSPVLGATYRTRQLRTDVAIRNLLAFGGTILAFSDDSAAHELSGDLDMLRPVDLAGQGQMLAPFPEHDPVTGDLHLIARADDGIQSHVVVTTGALTRRCRPILDAPCRITGLALTSDQVVLVADGVVGVAPREGAARTTWIATGTRAPFPLFAHEAGDDVVLLALTPWLERWTVRAGAGALTREVLDPSPQRFVHHHERVVWTTGIGVIRRHDLAALSHVDHRLGAGVVAGDFVVVPDASRPHADGAWLVGFVHDAAGTTAELRVIDAIDIARPAVATVVLPRPVPPGLRCNWTP